MMSADTDNGPGPTEAEMNPMLEGWVTLGALAASVPDLRLGLMVGGNTYRHPGVVANMALTLDHISGGRAVLGLGAATGAALADALDRTAEVIRERRELASELNALTAQSRASALLVAAAPVAFLAVFGLTDPGSLGVLVTSPLGWVCLLAGIGLDGIGFWWMRRLVGTVT